MNPQLKIKLLTAATILVLILMTIGVSAAVYYTLKVRSTGKIKGVGVKVYADPEATIIVSEIDWGILEPGETKNLTIYVKNEGNVPANLTMHTETWNPAAAASYITLTWSYDGRIVAPEDIIPVMFTLSVDPNITGISEFCFDIVIVASG